MPKPPLVPEQALLEAEIIETLIAGHHQWRPDLPYPESHSDMQGAVRGLMRMFEVRRRPLPEALETPCADCAGSGYFVRDPHHRDTCPKCQGRGRLAL